MAIKPVDFQVMIPKTAEVSKIHNDENHKGQVIGQQQAAAAQTKAEDNLRQVHSQDNVQKPQIREKQERNQGNKKEEKKKNKNGKNQEQQSTIDIRL